MLKCTTNKKIWHSFKQNIAYMFMKTCSFLWTFLFPCSNFRKLAREKSNLIQMYTRLWRDIIMKHVMIENTSINLPLKIAWEKYCLQQKAKWCEFALFFWKKCVKCHWRMRLKRFRGSIWAFMSQFPNSNVWMCHHHHVAQFASFDDILRKKNR